MGGSTLKKEIVVPYNYFCSFADDVDGFSCLCEELSLLGTLCFLKEGRVIRYENENVIILDPFLLNRYSDWKKKYLK